MAKSVLFAHGGSGNHGCEAIVRSLSGLCGFSTDDLLLSETPQEDFAYGIGSLLKVEAASRVVSQNFLYRLRAKLSGDPDCFFFRQKYRPVRAIDANNAFSIGGDNYCYHDMDKQMMVMRNLIASRSKRVTLVGCSVNPDTLDIRVLDDMKKYSCIWTRESLTYQALKARSFDNLVLMPDPAFTLSSKNVPLPEEFAEGNTVGINVSPMIIGYEKAAGMTLENYITLIQYIIKHTDMQIALIPHVVWSHNDDRKPLLALHEQFKDTGRVIMIDAEAKLNAEELKYIISKCRFLVAARTHASIAAYSTQVPTLVVGYSVKARGIARDIFGTEENYVLPVQSMTQPDELTNAFHWLMEHEDKIHKHYHSFMPEYISRIDVSKVL